jgi:hypothetical protein
MEKPDTESVWRVAAKYNPEQFIMIDNHYFLRLFNNHVSVYRLYSAYGRMIDEWRFKKDLEGIGRGLTEVLSQNFREGNKQNHKKKTTQNSQSPGEDRKYKPELLITVEQSVKFDDVVVDDDNNNHNNNNSINYYLYAVSTATRPITESTV